MTWQEKIDTIKRLLSWGLYVQEECYLEEVIAELTKGKMKCKKHKTCSNYIGKNICVGEEFVVPIEDTCYIPPEVEKLKCRDHKTCAGNNNSNYCNGLGYYGRANSCYVPPEAPKQHICIKDVVMDLTKEIAFNKGAIYKETEPYGSDYWLENNQGEDTHNIPKCFYKEHFIPLVPQQRKLKPGTFTCECGKVYEV